MLSANDDCCPTPLHALVHVENTLDRLCFSPDSSKQRVGDRLLPNEINHWLNRIRRERV